MLTQTIRDWWHALTGRHAETATPSPEVIVHDPEAEQPHDLDDPFFDPRVQSRIADVIASNAKKSH